MSTMAVTVADHRGQAEPIARQNLQRYEERAVVLRKESLALLGILTVPDGLAASAGVLIVPGGAQNRVGSRRQFVDLARRLAQAGIASLRIDLAGMGDSPGELPSFEQAGPSLALAIHSLCNLVDGVNSVMLWGLCDGASAALLFPDEELPPVLCAIVGVNPWARSPQGQARAQLQTHYLVRLRSWDFWRNLLQARKVGWAGVIEFCQAIRASRNGAKPGSGDELPERIARSIGRLRIPMLFICGSRDPTGAEFMIQMRRRRALSGHFVRLIELPDADHSISAASDWVLVVDTTVSFLRESISLHSVR